MRKRGIKIIINLSNRVMYTLIALTLILIISVGVYAVAGVSHSSSELDEADPTVPSSIKDGISWNEISGIPADIADGDDVGGHGNGNNCPSGQYSRGVDANGNAQGCTSINNWNKGSSIYRQHNQCPDSGKLTTASTCTKQYPQSGTVDNTLLGSLIN